MKRTSSATWVKGIADMFASQGLDLPRLFTAAGIDIAQLQQPDARFDAEAISRLWELAVAWSGNPSLGMDRELANRHVNFDLVGYVMLASPTLKAGLKCFARYLAVISDAATFELEPQGSQHCWLVLGHIGNSRPVPRQRQEYGLLALSTLCCWITRRDVQPRAAEFTFPEPADAGPYLRAFGCPVRFNGGATRLLLDNADLDTPLPSSDPMLFDMHQRVIEARLVRLGHASAAHRVSEAIVRLLHLGEPRREAIANSLAMADRTLQRRLQEEGTSFQQLLDDARRDLAQKYLAEARYTLTQVADLLGFADQSNFFRAHKRWFGMSPGQYRARLLTNEPVTTLD
ncbi:AraC-like DNA-binding protein [Hydrogenophaga palleronii]|uniref:AraC-like DNA-binding protein n=1 Tax=Hydrogenophaga palleronii TaxID=65655 RepID=A0ABU1WQZ2_9BURK|nr:AraC family transcriptional regulator [Hydrogenophaga palleronii]MDR7151447.1 AraC-like DNA-binding protein [Hydrogenophaga palleronii]